MCALPFASLAPDLRRRILDSLPGALSQDGVALVLQYTLLIQSELRRLFPSVRRRFSPLNVPPTFLFVCHLRPDAG